MISYIKNKIRSGFTPLELLLVIGISAVMAGLFMFAANAPQQMAALPAINVNVEAPNVTVNPPDVNVNVAPAQVSMGQPDVNVNVEAAKVATAPGRMAKAPGKTGKLANKKVAKVLSRAPGALAQSEGDYYCQYWYPWYLIGCIEGNVWDYQYFSTGCYGDGASTCKLMYCGDSVIDPSEECDDGETNGTIAGGCNANCDGYVSVCGDGVVEGAEECDDTNLVSGDGCSSECMDEYCGDGTINNSGTETCDDGNPFDDDYCSYPGCQPNGYCGDGIIQTNEQCDDGNTDETDSCFNNCTLQECVVEWAEKIDGPGGLGPDQVAKVVMDASGNVYVTGRSTVKGEADNIFTVKYPAVAVDMNGDGYQDPEWVASYDGAGGLDIAFDIALDSFGNAYVTGRSEGATTGADVVTIKYPTSAIDSNSDGLQDPVWVDRYATDGVDVGKVIVIDSSNNVYVGGESESNFMALRYPSSGGAPMVYESYNGETDAFDGINDIAVDSNGNLFATGVTIGNAAGDFYTVKYDTSGDIIKWAQYNNVDKNDEDSALAIELDEAHGNVIVAGNSYGDAFDYLTIVYDFNLVQKSGWPQRWDKEEEGNSLIGNDGIAVDSDGNIYVTGNATGDTGGGDYYTVSYNTAGVMRANYPASFDGGIDIPSGAITLYEDSGHPYFFLTGSSFDGTYNFSTIKFDGISGAVLGSAVYDGTAGSNDFSRDVFVNKTTNEVVIAGDAEMSGAGLDYVVQKFDLSLGEKWTGRYSGGEVSPYDDNWAVAVNGAGYTASIATTGTGSLSDILFALYDPEGNLVNGNYSIFDGVGLDDQARDVTFDSDGNFYVLGTTNNGPAPSTRIDYALIKYDSNGNYVWDTSYHNPDSAGTGYTPNDYPNTIVVDDDGNVYAAGFVFNQDLVEDKISADCAVVKYSQSADGLTPHYEWTGRYNSEDNDDDGTGGRINSVVKVDGDGNVYLTCYSYLNSTGYDMVVLKYSADGDLMWNEPLRYDGGSGDYDEPGAGILLDDEGNFYLPGISYKGEIPGYDFALLKYSQPTPNAYVLEWEANYDHGFDFLYGADSDPLGNIYVTGTVDQTKRDYATLKYSPDFVDADGDGYHDHEWVRFFNHITDGDEQATRVAADAWGNVYVTGKSNGAEGTGEDMATVIYDTYGNPQCATVYPNKGSDRGIDLSLDSCGRPSVVSDFNSDMLAVKFSLPVLNSLNLLQYDIAAVDVKNGVSGLSVKLDSAVDAFIDAKGNNFNAAINKLNAFINQSNADSLLSAEDRERLVKRASCIIEDMQ